MRPIAILPHTGHEMGAVMNKAITYLRKAEIEVRKAVIGQTLALVWVDDENISISVEGLRNAGFQATALTETDGPH
jgi:hypothetical protein